MGSCNLVPAVSPMSGITHALRAGGVNRELKICNAAARRRAFKTKNIFIEDNTMNNLWSHKCCELRSHSQYNLKLSISTSLEQRKNVFRREKCFWCPSYSWHRIVSANKTVNKLLRQVSNGRYRHQIPKILFLIIYIYTASRSCRVVDLKLPYSIIHRYVTLFVISSETFQPSFFSKSPHYISHHAICLTASVDIQYYSWEM